MGTGFLIALYSGLIEPVYAFIHFTYINPSFADYTDRCDCGKNGRRLDLSDAQMEAAEKFTRMFYVARADVRSWA